MKKTLLGLCLLAFFSCRPTGSQMIIGDSQAILIAKSCPALKCPPRLSGEGWGTDRLLKAVSEAPTYRDIKKLYVVIGTNDQYNAAKVPNLVAEIKDGFPNAQIVLIVGSYGWGNVQNVENRKLKDYARVWKKNGCSIHPMGIGFTPIHPMTTTPGIQDVCLTINQEQ